MIPVKLTLRNFMCYRDNVPPLYFNGLHVACLYGDNGNGKSALLDAMTWALWGEARAKSDDELVHLGQVEMEVEFEFVVGRERYRVIRKRTKPRPGRTGQTILEFQVAAEQGFRSITGNSVRETQRKIIQTLHMDYPTFINSAFLLQGRADEFTKKLPSQRKEVLSDILGLAQYDKYEERTKDYVKTSKEDEARLRNAIDEIQRELARKQEYEVELREARAAVAEIDGQVKRQEGILNTLREARRDLENKQHQLAEVEEKIKQAKKELGDLEGQIREYDERIKGYETILAQSPVVEEKYAQLLAAREANEQLTAKLAQLLALKERKRGLEQTLEKARGELVAEQKLAQSDIDRLEAKSKMTPSLDDELRKARAQLDGVFELDRALAEKRGQEQQLSSRIHYLRSANDHLEEEIRLLKEKINLLAQGDARCPLCETELGIGGRERIQEKYQAERQNKAGAYRSNEEEIGKRRKEQETIKGEVAQLESTISSQRVAGQSRVATLEKEIVEAKEAAEEAARRRAHLAQISQRLARSDFAVGEQAALRELAAQEADLAYDGERHEAVRRQVEGLDKYESLHRKLEEAKKFIDQESAALARAEEARTRSRMVVEADSQKKEALSVEVAKLPEIVAKLVGVERHFDVLRDQQAQGHQRLGAVQQKLERCVYLEGEKGEKESELREASKQRGIYEELVVAFGKKGIQALLIESALPQIEDEANRLLGRMTDNRMHVKLETQRAKKTKKGEIEETLEIKISDELGTRSYELFSGGESFRINFALRIALSRLLARRAGAPLPTLIIDEGFGTQDSSGRERLIEAINSIQDDFEKILVITHIEELKDIFPVRIEVTKTAEGSMIEVS